MKFFVLGFIAIMAAYSFARTCRRYDCDDKLTSMCAKVDSSLVTLNPCEVNSRCEFTYQISGDFKCVPKEPFYFPGEYCGENCTWCISKKFNNETFVCTGNKATEECKSDIDCNAGLYCLKGTCNATRAIGDFCNATYKCDPSALCTDGKCVLIGSLEEGAANKIPILCNTYHANTTHCVKGPKLQEDTCSSSDICKHKYEDSRKVLAVTCVCGKQNDTAAICPMAMGDVPIFDVMPHLLISLVLQLC